MPPAVNDGTRYDNPVGIARVWLGLAVAITLAITVGGATTGCGGAPPQPKRGVVESDLGSWHFRRFQPVLDVEVWVENNKAEAYTASYVSISPRGRVTSRTRTS